MKDGDLVNLKKHLDALFSVLGKSNGVSILDDAQSIWLRSPFNVGDYVSLKETPVINKDTNFGWRGYTDILVKGNRAVIKERHFNNGVFYYLISFDKDATVSFFCSEHHLIKFENNI
jgi:hypothetical protein